MSVFKANDIRGVYGEELTDALAYRIGKATGMFLRSPEVIVARDMRVSSPDLTEALIHGLRDQGVGVLDLGLVDVPCLYFATGYLKLPGIMVTASHNPAKYNGFVICSKEAVPINESNGLLSIEKLANSKHVFKNAAHPGSLRSVDLQKQYLNHIRSFVDPKLVKGLNVVIDAGNGMGGWIAPLVYSSLPLKYTLLYGKLDGAFPNHLPNPAIYSTLNDLGKTVVRKKAAFGIAYDGDADRAGFVDERGVPIEGSAVGALIAKFLLSKQKGAVVYSSTCSHNLPEAVRASGGLPIRDRVGHTFIKTRMRKEKALFGAENTGHFFYRDNFYADSGIISSLLMCQLYQHNGKKMSHQVMQVTKYCKLEEVNLVLKNTKNLLNDIARVYKEHGPRRIDWLDGLTVEFSDYWFSVRMSQTEPVVRLNLEAHSEDGAHIYLKKLISVVKKLGS